MCSMFCVMCFLFCLKQLNDSFVLIEEIKFRFLFPILKQLHTEQSKITQRNCGICNMFISCNAHELPSPFNEWPIQAWFHIEWTGGVQHPFDSLFYDARSGKWYEMTGRDITCISIAAVVKEVALIDNRY